MKTTIKNIKKNYNPKNMNNIFLNERLSYIFILLVFIMVALTYANAYMNPHRSDEIIFFFGALTPLVTIFYIFLIFCIACEIMEKDQEKEFIYHGQVVNIPCWAKFIATDKNGNTFAYNYEVKTDHGFWVRAESFKDSRVIGYRTSENIARLVKLDGEIKIKWNESLLNTDIK